MDWIMYKLKAENLAKRLETAYHKTGGEFLFVWVHDASTFTLSFTATANFTSALAGQGSTPLSHFFHAASRHTGSSPNCIYLWSIIGIDNTKKVIVTGPEQSGLTSKRKATERARQPDYIIKEVVELKKEGFPFVLLYRPLRRAATEEQLAICEVFPETHAPVLVETDAWKQLQLANAILPPPRTKFGVVNRRSAAVQSRLGPTLRQFNSAVVGGGWESAEIKEQRRREYLKPLQEAGLTDNVLEQMNQLLYSSSSIPPTLVRNDDDELQVVMPDFSGEKETVSRVPVLVSLQRHGEDSKCRCTCRLYRLATYCAHVGLIVKYEDQFRELNLTAGRDAGIVPIEDTTGVVVAYTVHGKIVRLLQEKGEKKFSCTHCTGSDCSHARDAINYADEYGIGCVNLDCLEGTEEVGDDRHRYLKLKDDHYHLPTGLNWPKSPSVADAIERLLLEGKNVFKDRVRSGEHALAPQAEGPCSCEDGCYDSASYEFVSTCSLFMERSGGCLKLPVYNLHCSHKNPACCKRYDGSADGVFMISKTQAVAVGYLYRHLEQYHASGMSPAAFYSSVVEYEYKGPYQGSKPSVDLFSENTYRDALFLFMCSLRNASTVPTFRCPHCKNCPESLIVDGTSLTMQGDRCSGLPINAVPENAPVVEQQHNMNSRAFFNVKEDRKELQKVLKGYAKAIKAIDSTSQCPLPKLSDCGEKLEVNAGSFGLDLFLKWVDEKVQAKQLTKSERKAIYYFLGRNLATNSPVIAYFPNVLVSLIKDTIRDGNRLLQRSTVDAIAASSPSLFNVLKIAGARRSRQFTVPEAFVPLLTVLCERASHCTAGPGIERVDELPQEDSRRQHSSAESLECITTGVCVGLPQLRERPKFEADKNKDPTGCNKQFLQGRGRTGGVMTIFCPHGFCYAGFILPKAESRDHLFSFMVKYLEKPPKYLVYDFGCAALDYCLNRLPGWFKDMVVVVDRMHWDNHTACCYSFNMRIYEDLDGLNSQIAEQCNAALRKINPTLHRSSQPFFMVMLRQYLHGWNTKKQKVLSVGLGRVVFYE